MMELLKLDGITVRFGAVAAIQDLSLSVNAGGLVGVLGPNGAGKTTLLRAVLNRVGRQSGRVWFDGKEVTHLSTRDLVRAGIAMCPENRRLFPDMSIEDNLRLGAYGQRRAVVNARLAEMYERFAWVAARRRELAGRFSGGEQQTVAIARSLMAKPKLLLLDEPSSGLSPIAINGVREVLASIPQSGTSMLLVEQNVTLVEGLCDEAWVLARGRVRDHGPVGELLAGVRVADVYLGAADIDEQIETTHHTA